MDNNLLKDEDIDQMNERQLSAYINHVDESMNDPYNGVDLNDAIALTILKNKARNRMDVLKRESLKV